MDPGGHLLGLGADQGSFPVHEMGEVGPEWATVAGHQLPQPRLTSLRVDFIVSIMNDRDSLLE